MWPFSSPGVDPAMAARAAAAAGGAPGAAVDPVAATRAAMAGMGGGGSALRAAAPWLGRAGLAGAGLGVALEALNPGPETRAAGEARVNDIRERWSRSGVEAAASLPRHVIGHAGTLVNQGVVQPALAGLGSVVRGAFGLEAPNQGQDRGAGQYGPPAPAEQVAPASTAAATPTRGGPVFSNVDPISGTPMMQQPPAWRTDARSRPLSPTMNREEIGEWLTGLPRQERANALSQAMGRQPSQRVTGADLARMQATQWAQQQMAIADAAVEAGTMTPAARETRQTALMRMLMGIGSQTIDDLMSAGGQRN